jgi:hypothetical protein
MDGVLRGWVIGHPLGQAINRHRQALTTLGRRGLLRPHRTAPPAKAQYLGNHAPGRTY